MDNLLENQYIQMEHQFHQEITPETIAKIKKKCLLLLHTNR